MRGTARILAPAAWPQACAFCRIGRRGRGGTRSSAAAGPDSQSNTSDPSPASGRRVRPRSKRGSTNVRPWSACPGDRLWARILPLPAYATGFISHRKKNPAVIREHVPLFYQATIELSLTRDPIVRQLTFMAARQPLIVAQTAARKGEQRRPSRRKRRFSKSRIIGLVSASLGEIDVHRSEMGRTCPDSFQGHGLMGINVCLS